jgi:hypothetical protein
MKAAALLLALATASCAASALAGPVPSAGRKAGVEGPVGVSSDGRFFLDAAGRPTFWLGDTQWELFLSFKEEEAEALLEDRRAKGFNAIQVMLLGVGGGKKPNASGARPFLNDALSTPNEAYFSAVDRIVRIAARKGLVLVIGIYHKSPEYARMITPENARAWASWVARRYRSFPNLIWSMYPVARDSSVPIVRELAAGLAEGDGGAHLVTVHPDPSPASSSFIHAEPWLSFNTLQTWQSNFLNSSMVASDYARSPAKPVVNGEARYEAEGGTTPLNVRNGAWWSCLAGGFYSFGHGGNWMKPAEWKSWLDSPGSRQMKVLGDFFRSLDWWTLVPDPAIVSGAAAQKAAARSSRREWAIAYLSGGGSLAIDLAAANATGSADASWMNPASGEVRPAGTFLAAGIRTFAAPEGWADAVLLVRAARSDRGFASLFDGRTLEGWKAPDMSWFSVQDGAITGEVTEPRRPPRNQFIVWQGGTVRDFDLRFRFRIFGAKANSGMQFRSAVKEHGLVHGYQADIALAGPYLGGIWDEYGPRRSLAARGESSVIDEEGKKAVARFADAADLATGIDLSQWTDYRIVARGPHLVLEINGRTMCELVDRERGKAAAEGVLAMPVIPEPMKVQYKDLRVMILD